MQTPFYRVPGYRLPAPAENFFLEQSSSCIATEIALNNSRLVENPENFGRQNWLLRLAARNDDNSCGG